ncbi:glutathione S-transferase family protein [Aurantivibrio plasticivorans]
MEIYGDIKSGNCYKVKLLCDLLGKSYEWIHVDILDNDTHTPEFLAMNPNGKIPVIRLENGKCLSESNAILHFLAEGTEMLPADIWARANVLQWQFFEQYSHEPFIAVARYIALYLGLPDSRRDEYESKRADGNKALTILNDRLSQSSFLVGDNPTIADISLFAYTHVASDGGFDLDNYPQVQRWINDIQRLPGFTPMSID